MNHPMGSFDLNLLLKKNSKKNNDKCKERGSIDFRFCHLIFIFSTSSNCALPLEARYRKT